MAVILSGIDADKVAALRQFRDVAESLSLRSLALRSNLECRFPQSEQGLLTM